MADPVIIPLTCPPTKIGTAKNLIPPFALNNRAIRHESVDQSRGLRKPPDQP